jgi:hypothetical protein
MGSPLLSTGPLKSEYSGVNSSTPEKSALFKNYYRYPWLYLIAFLYGLRFAVTPATDPDLGWHLFGGEILIRTGALPAHDPINTFGTVWQNYHWLAELIFTWIYRNGGLVGLQIAHGALMTWLCLILADIINVRMRAGGSTLLGVAAFICSGAFLFLITSIRPQSIAILTVALALRRAIQPPRSYELLYFFLLSVFTANVHVYWVFIPFIYLCYRVHIISHTLISFLTLCCAGFITPYGLSTYTLLFEYARMPEFLNRMITELHSGLLLDGLIPFLLVGWFGIAILLLRKHRIKHHLSDLFVAIFAWLLTLKNIKFGTIFAVTAFPLTITLCLPWIRRFAPRICGTTDRLVITKILYLFLVGSLTIAIARDFPVSEEKSYATVLNAYPIRACEALTRAPSTPTNDRNHIRVLTHFNFGGWCRFAAYTAAPGRDIRVTTDGRTQWMPADYFRKSLNLYGLGPGWRETLKEWQPDFIVAQNTSPLSQLLPYLPDWNLIFQDTHFVTYRRTLAVGRPSVYNSDRSKSL